MIAEDVYSNSPVAISDKQCSNAEAASEVSSMNSLTAGPQNDIAFRIGQSVEEVEAVFLEFNEENKLFTVFTVIPERDRSICRRVYSVEREIIDSYAGFDFAFSVLASNGQNPRTLVQDPSMHLAFAR